MATQTETTSAQLVNNAGLRVPWGLHPIEDWVIAALNSRVLEYDVRIPTTATVGASTQLYAGPRSAWGRIFSTGISKDDKLKNRLGGFVLGGSEDFNASYGFGSENQVIIGRTSTNVPHIIPANAPGDLPHRPPPNLVSIESELLSGQNSSFPGAVRKVNVVFKCHNLTQLKYLVPYFFTPRIPVVIEWGWNNYNPSALLDLTNIEELKKAYSDPAHSLERIKRTNGNYEVAMGQIFDYGYNLNDAGGYDCFVTIQNSNLLIEGRSHQTTTIQKNASTGASTEQPLVTPGSTVRRTDKVKIKDFNEFIFEDLGTYAYYNIFASTEAQEAAQSYRISTSDYTGLEDPAATAVLERANRERSRFRVHAGLNKGQFFKPEKTPNAPANHEQRVWIRMEQIVAIINRFFKLTMLDSDGNDTGVIINKLNIKNVKISAHPAIKSISKNILLPNQFAPRFTIKQDSQTSTQENPAIASGNLSSVVIENAEYLTLFAEAVNEVIVKNNYTDEFDNLKEIINPEGNSFPVFKDEKYVDPFGRELQGIHKAGYWGYLEDIYVDLKHFQDLVRESDTLKILIESLLKSISAAMSDICALKLVVADGNNTEYTVVDNNNTPITNTENAGEFPIIALNSIGSAYLKTATLSVKVSSDMAAQMVLQSASRKELSGQYSQGNNDPKTMPVSDTSQGSILFDIGVHDLSEPSNKSDNSSQSTYTRMLAVGSNFYTYRVRTEKNETDNNQNGGVNTKKVSSIKEYILVEKDAGLMRSILNNKQDKNATYINNTIMPGTKFEMELLGLGGIRYLSQFKLANVLDQYNYKNAVWQVSMIKHKVEDKIWTTYVMAEARPMVTLQTTTTR